MKIQWEESDFNTPSEIGTWAGRRVRKPVLNTEWMLGYLPGCDRTDTAGFFVLIDLIDGMTTRHTAASLVEHLNDGNFYPVGLMTK